MAATPISAALPAKSSREEETSTDSGCSEGSDTPVEWSGTGRSRSRCVPMARSYVQPDASAAQRHARFAHGAPSLRDEQLGPSPSLRTRDRFVAQCTVPSSNECSVRAAQSDRAQPTEDGGKNRPAQPEFAAESASELMEECAIDIANPPEECADLDPTLHQKNLSLPYQVAPNSPAQSHQIEFQPEMDANANTLSPAQTLILLDWDDTILPSSWVTRLGLTLGDDTIVSEEIATSLNSFANVASNTLELMQKMGTVVMVTNAETGWIELSCQKFMPTLLEEILKLQHVSARSTYEPLGVISPLEWKIYAFKREIAKFFGDDLYPDHAATHHDEIEEPIRNIISMGDSSHERDAVMRATECSKHSHTKSLKMLERPEIAQLREQHELIASFFSVIAQYDGHLDLCIKCS